MLTPDELSVLPQNVVDVFKQLEEYIITDIARRLKSAGTMTETALHQIRALQDYGYTDIDKAIIKATALSEKELDKMYDEAIQRSWEFDNKVYDKLGLLHPPIDKSFELLSIINALKQQTKNELRNFTGSLGFAENIGGVVQFKPIAKFYQDTLDFAQLQVQSGGVDYNTAIRQAVGKMANSGLRTVDYATGYTNRAEVAVRRAVLTGLGQTSAKMTEQTMKDLETDLVEVSAHSGARPTHAAWQGKVYSFSGTSDKYPSLTTATGYGTGDGLMGWNCRHNFFAFIDGGSERAYTDEELESIDPPPFEYEGKTYTAYEATQMQRKLETSIRKEKLKQIGFEETVLKDDLLASQIKQRSLKAYYTDFSKRAGLKTQLERTQVVGYGKGISGRAVQADKKHYLKFIGKYSQSGAGFPKTVDKYREIKYNDKKEYGRIQKYIDIVNKGEISPLIGYEIFNTTAKQIENELLGIKTSKGLIVSDYSAHFVGRALGEVGTDKKYNRKGVSIVDIKGALTNGTIGKEQIDKYGNVSVLFIGDNCDVSVNKHTGKLIQTNLN